MTDKNELRKRLTALNLDVTERAVGLLWYYLETQEFDERSPGELAKDIEDIGFTRPNTTRLKQELNKSRFAVNGQRSGTKKLNIRYIDQLNQKYSSLIGDPTKDVTNSVLPAEWIKEVNHHIGYIIHQINGCFDNGFYDGSAVLMRRLMETLIIEVYIFNHRASDIRNATSFLMLDRLIQYIKNDNLVTLSRGVPTTMEAVKELGDIAAHNRTYRIPADDIHDLRTKYRVMISDLLSLSRSS